MPLNKGTNIFLGAIVAIATLCALYNLAWIPSEAQALRRFRQDPSCHPAVGRETIAGACEFEHDTLIDDPQVVMGRSGPSYLLSLRTPAGGVVTAQVYADIDDPLRRGIRSVGRLIYDGQVIAIYAGPASEPTLAYPSLAGRTFNAVYSAAIAILFAVPLALRIRRRVRSKRK
ncbi:hypothetical protein [Pararobbsia silviterrae]|uniref:Uncharacterized protein n=1 Tax=Pararobbsia silviterrae TaxID=1792498 RepID=A0A494Y6R9_9BURK|nr:hypothetical protein [Pararobbsia silviterrae]RKP57772.1 hypothetical protein D7S86_07520 [Pararobbsia silviterrae]